MHHNEPPALAACRLPFRRLRGLIAEHFEGDPPLVFLDSAATEAARWAGGLRWLRDECGIAPARANLVYTTQPIFSAIFAALLLAEQPTAATCVGGALILAAVASESALLLSEEDRDARPDAP